MKLVVKHIVLIMLLLVVSHANAENHNELMQQANEAYINENYHQAIEIYEQIRQMQWESHILYYNLGNTYYQTGQRGKAILNYERALRLNPNDEATRHNLRIARAALPERYEQLPQLFFLDWRDGFVRLLPVDGWATVLVVLVMAISLCTGLFFVIRNRVLKKTVFMLGLVLLISLFLSIYATNRQYHFHHVRQEAVVMSPRVTAKSAPGERGIDVFVIHEGVKVVIQSELMDWYEVRLPNGNVGWINSETLEII